MRKAAFRLVDGEQNVEVTAIDLPTGAGDLLANINRWRKQIQLTELSAEELPATLQPIEVMGSKGHYVELTTQEGATPRLAILGVIVQHGERVWFFKLTGTADLAMREKEKFKSFVTSAKLATSGGAAHD